VANSAGEHGMISGVRGALALVIVACVPMALVGCNAPAEVQAPRPDPELDKLFTELKTAPNPIAAGRIEKRIWERWNESGSPTIDVLMERAGAAEAKGDSILARRLLDEATKLEPSYAEPWNRRAILAYGQEDFGSALHNIQETLKREPRHFGAYVALGSIYEGLGQKRAALEAYSAALDVHPYLEDAKQGAERIEPSLTGDET
jgi:tetratricopeptide (TPR) repeat protein